MSKSYHKRPKSEENPDGSFYYRWNVKQYRYFDSGHSRPRKPRRSCSLCHHWKFLGNSKDRRPFRDQKRLVDRIEY